MEKVCGQLEAVTAQLAVMSTGKEQHRAAAGAGNGGYGGSLGPGILRLVFDPGGRQVFDPGGVQNYVESIKSEILSSTVG